jgi:SAM-dependent methyltransferase
MSGAPNDPAGDAPATSEERSMPSLDECYFYHVMDIPGVGRVGGEWDLRGRVDDYIGRVDVSGRRVLDVGPASGFISFELEARGAEVVALELGEDSEWDIVPYAALDRVKLAAESREHLRRLTSGFWFAHRALGSHVRVVRGDAYTVPPDVGTVDIALLASVLLHLRDPFRAIDAVSKVTREAIVITDVAPPRTWLAHRILNDLPHFRPDPTTCEPWESWWQLTPGILRRMLQIVGFADIRMHRHSQTLRGKDVRMFTLVARPGLVSPRKGGSSV